MPWSRALTQKLTYCACFDSGGRRSTWRKPTQAENMQTDLNPGPSCSEPTLCHHAASDYTRRYQDTTPEYFRQDPCIIPLQMNEDVLKRYYVTADIDNFSYFPHPRLWQT